jgi:hypothetical protein
VLVSHSWSGWKNDVGAFVRVVVGFFVSDFRPHRVRVGVRSEDVRTTDPSVVVYGSI